MSEEKVGWVATYGEKPNCLSDVDFGWLRTDEGIIGLVKTTEYIRWSRTTHFYPDATIKEPEFNTQGKEYE